MNDSLYFSLGPVQGFVAAARRTRDLWAGSWLLSHLAERAVAVMRNSPGVTLCLPAVIDRSDDMKNIIAGTPNRLIAEGDGNALATAAENAAKAVRKRWKEIASAVWKKHVEPVVSHGQDTRSIWDRQVDHFWEINWVIGSDDHGRKMWRSNMADVEPGYRCALFPHLQELSGHVGMGRHNGLGAFWEKIRGASMGQYDLDEDEALSAIGLIKRLYPRLDEFKNLDVTNWPSTAWVAALPWIRQVENTPQAKAYTKAVVDTIESRRPFDSTAAASLALKAKAETFACLDGQLLFERGIVAESQEPDAKGRRRINEATKKAMWEPYQKLTDKPRGKPVPWFAVLVMDGDQMGKLLGQLGETERGKVSAALGAFAQKVDPLVSENGGRTVYAGGDDVMALLPASGAIECAQALRAAYAAAFAEQLGAGHDALQWVGISAGLVFADWKTPLRQVLVEAHDLLDDVAKEATGRDSLAISVWLSSGKSCQWAAPWQVVGDAKEGLLADLLRCGSPSEVSASFLYGVRESLVGLLDNPYEKPGIFAELPAGLDVAAVLQGDLVRIHGDKNLARHAEIAKALAKLSQQHRRSVDASGNPSFHSDPTSFSFDGLRLARFLAQLNETTAVSGVTP